MTKVANGVYLLTPASAADGGDERRRSAPALDDELH
jgi:hypothetical protein